MKPIAPAGRAPAANAPGTPDAGARPPGRILWGTCAWSDHTGFYPPGMKAAQRLGHYALHFPLVEVDSTFYRIPAARAAAAWAERTPAGFRFDVKPYRSLTLHDRGRELVDWDRDRAAFSGAVAPLAEAGKLRALNFQFPPWFRPSGPHHDHLARIRDAFPDRLIAVEFRHRAWFASAEAADQTIALLRSLGFAHVVADEPQVGSGSVPPVVAVARRDVAVVRFHGRNAATWYARTASSGDRFNYVYSDAELRAWLPEVRRLAAAADEVHLLFNNNHEDAAVVNARQLADLAGLAWRPDGPPRQLGLLD